MKHLKRFESIHLGGYELQQGNLLEEVFGENLYKLKELVQSTMPNQNLMYIGSGTKGISFEWLGNHQLPKDFTKKGFKGTLVYTSGLVIKVTPFEDEYKTALKLLKRGPGMEIPGVVKYYWIKEIALPQELKLSKYLEPIQAPDLRRFKTFMTRNPDIPRDESAFRSWRTRRIDRDFPPGQEKEKAEFFKEFKKKERGHKQTTIWIICQELVEIPDARQKFILDELSMIPRNEIKKVAKGAKVDKRILQDLFEDSISGMDTDVEEDISFEEFEELFWKWNDLLENVKKYKIPSNDLDATNMGFRRDELVAFDCN